MSRFVPPRIAGVLLIGSLPARHTLGDALPRADRAVEAKNVFNEDLKKYPNNCVALAELAAANARGTFHHVLRSTLRKCPRIFHIVQSDRHAP